jgi:mannosyltransferase OCH1-like enzyme
MKTIDELSKRHFDKKIILDKNHTYEESLKHVKTNVYEKQMQKINEFNNNVDLLNCDNNNMPKIIHLTCKDKTKITNPIWIECFNKIKNMYSDYNIIIYDNNDIYKIVETFDKKNLHFIKNIVIGATLADIFRYLILYFRGGYYFDFDCEPIKHISQLSNTHFHGDNNNNIYIYPKNKRLLNSSCDFYCNPCNNCKNININNEVVTYKCLGHNYINKQTNIIVGYEFEKTWNQNIIDKESEKDKWMDNNIGICQWFIGSKPNQSLFLHCYKKSLENLKHIDLNKNNKNFHYQVINSTGPLFFTKMINSYFKKNNLFKNNIAIFPSDFFSCGSGNSVPFTKNSFVKHRYTGSWLK